jgi:hypothetical protein
VHRETLMSRQVGLKTASTVERKETVFRQAIFLQSPTFSTGKQRGVHRETLMSRQVGLKTTTIDRKDAVL